MGSAVLKNIRFVKGIAGRVIPAIVSGTRKLHAETSSNFTLLGVRGPARLCGYELELTAGA
jgi:hypothetical protein